MNFQLPGNERCLSAPDATSLHHCFQNHRQCYTILNCIQALDTKGPVEPWVKGFLRYMPSPFYSASVVLFQLHGGTVSHMQALAIPSSTVHKTWILTTESISVLAACSWVMASGADRHLLFPGS